MYIFRGSGTAFGNVVRIKKSPHAIPDTLTRVTRLRQWANGRRCGFTFYEGSPARQSTEGVLTRELGNSKSSSSSLLLSKRIIKEHYILRSTAN